MKSPFVYRRFVSLVTTATALTFAIATPSALAIHCIENFRPVGEPQLYPFVTEIADSDIGAMKAAFGAVVSTKPKVWVYQNIKMVKIGGDSPRSFSIFGFEGPWPYFRPDVHEMEGYVRKISEQDGWKTAAEYVHTKNDIKPNFGDPADRVTRALGGGPSTRQRWIAYGLQEKGMNMIHFETNEVIAAHMPLSANAHLVVTVRIDQRIGFRRTAEEAKRNFMVEVYQIDEGGHAVTSFRVDADELAFPKVQITKNTDGRLALQVEQNYFDLQLIDPKSLAKSKP